MNGSEADKLIALMQAGNRLFWFGDNGPELSGFPFWPQKALVRRLLKEGVLAWKEYANATQEACGICEIELTPILKAARKMKAGTM